MTPMEPFSATAVSQVAGGYWIDEMGDVVADAAGDPIDPDDWGWTQPANAAEHR